MTFCHSEYSFYAGESANTEAGATHSSFVQYGLTLSFLKFTPVQAFDETSPTVSVEICLFTIKQRWVEQLESWDDVFESVNSPTSAGSTLSSWVAHSTATTLCTN